MDKIDKKIKDLLGKLSKNKPVTKGGDCPGNQGLSSYIDGLLQDNERIRIEQHLSTCSDCLELLALYKKAADSKAFAESTDAPAPLKEKALKLFTSHAKEHKTGFLDIVLKATKEAIEVVSNAGNLPISFGAEPMPVRSGNEILSPNLIILNKTFSDMESWIEIEKVDDLNLNMKIRTVDTVSKTPTKVLRVSLFNPLRELASYITDDGEVYFGNLTYGEYKIKIIKDSEEIGKISLSIILN